MNALYVLAFSVVFFIALFIVIGGVRYFGARQQQARVALHAQRNGSRDPLPNTD